MPRHICGMVAHGILHEEYLGDRSSRGQKLCNLTEKRKDRGAIPAILWMRRGVEATRVCTSASVLLALVVFAVAQIARPAKIRREQWQQGPLKDHDLIAVA